MTTRVLAGLLTAALVLASGAAWAGQVHPNLEAKLAGLPPGGTLAVIVEMVDRVDPAAVAAGAPGLARRDRARAVVQALQAAANRGQGPIRALLAQGQAQGSVHRVVPFWIFNGLAVTATEPVIRQLAARPDVHEIRVDALIPPPAPVPAAATPATGPSEWNIERVRAPEVWALEPSFNGQGVVVGSLDTGVDGTHPDLAPRYRGNHAISWFDPYGEHAEPFDNDGHGTHTMGTAVGGDFSGAHIGVAPGATWIAAKGWSDDGIATLSAFHQAFQWLMAPGGDPANAPDVVNNSWVESDACEPEFLADVRAWRAAGIFPSFGAGNFGPFPRSVWTPASYPEAFGVGATDIFDDIAWFSSRGPSPCDNGTKPDVSAPGDGVFSTVPGGYIALSGTSMATPHVTGAVAVLLSINPALTVDELELSLTQGAVDLGANGADNSYGAGRLDLFQSAQLVLGGLGRPIVTIAATAASATEAGATPGVFTVSRTGSTEAALTVSYGVAGTATAGEDYATLTGTVTFEIGSATATVAVTPIDDPLVERNETVVVTLTSDPAYFVGTPGSATVTIVSDEIAADLSISKGDAPDPVIAGDPLTYTLSVGNDGPSAATAVTVTDPLPAGATLVSATASQGTCTGTSTVTCGLGSLAIGGSATVTIVVTPPAGTLTNTAQVSAAEPDPDPGNNAATAVTASLVPNPVPALASLSPSRAMPGAPAFTLTVDGSSFVPASVVRWKGTDRTTTFVSETRLQAAIPASDIAAAGTAQVTVFNPAPAGGTSGALTFTISVVTGNETLSVSPTTLQPAGTVTATWGGLAAPTTRDWLGLYTPGSADTAFLTYRYTTGAASGSVPLTLPTNVGPGTYELRLFHNNGYTRLATSNTFTVALPPPATLSVTPTSLAPGGTLTATWSGITSPTTTDWLGLYTPGSPDTAYKAYRFTTGAASGSVPFTLPASLPGGTYELRLFSNNGYTRLATSNAFTVTGPVTLSVSPTSVAAGGTVTATWSGIPSPTAQDWLGLYTPGSADTAFLAQRLTTGAASGNVPFTLPASLAAGTYELRLFSNSGFTRLAVSNGFTVTAPAPPPGPTTLSVSPTTVAPGGTVTATWSGIAAPTTRDWLGLYAPGAADASYMAYRYTTGAASGSLPFPLPASIAPGTYELRLFANGGYTRLATSNAFTVAIPPPPTLSVTPTTIAPGGTVTATWSGITSPTTTDWLGLFTPGSVDTAYKAYRYTTGAASGSVPFTLPTTLPAGTYELRLFSNNGYTRLATSNTFTVAP